MLLQVWVTAKFINFSEAAVIHSNALFTAAIMSSVRHGSRPHLTLPEKYSLCPETSYEKSDNHRWRSDL